MSDSTLLAINIYDKSFKILVFKVLNVQGNKLFEINDISDLLSVDLSPDGKYIALSSYDEVSKTSTIRLLDTFGKDRFPKIKSLKNIRYSQVKFSPDTKYLAVVTSGIEQNKSSIEIRNTQGELLHKSDSNIRLSRIVFSPDSKSIGTVGDDNTIQLLTIGEKNFRSGKGHSGEIYDIDFSNDSKHLVTTSLDKTIKIWSLDAKEIYTLPLDIKGNLYESNIYFVKNQDKQDRLLWNGSTDNLGKSFKIWDLGYDNLKGLGCYWLQNSKSSDPQSQGCHEPKYKKAAALSLVNEARSKVINGYPEEAKSIFLEAQKLDPSISFVQSIFNYVEC